MKIETIKSDEKIIYNHIFDNLYEMVNYIKTTEPFEEKWIMSSISKRYDSSKVSSLDEALRLCLNGYTDNFKTLVTDIEKLENMFPKFTNKRRTESCVYGFRPNINKIMTGNPNCMYRLVRKEETNFANFYFNVSCSWDTSTEAIMNKGIITIALIKFLEQLNFRVNLNFFEFSYSRDEYIYTNVTIKRPGELLDTSICNFPMCHPAFLRRICFAIQERVDVKNNYSWKNYGIPAGESKIYEIVKPEENSIILPSPNNIEVYGHDIISDTICFIEKTGFNKLFKDKQKLEYDEKQKKFILTK